MAQCMDYIKNLFPDIDDEMYHYIDGKLKTVGVQVLEAIQLCELLPYYILITW